MGSHLCWSLLAMVHTGDVGPVSGRKLPSSAIAIYEARIYSPATCTDDLTPHIIKS